MVFFSIFDPQLQVEFVFSKENLKQDIKLKVFVKVQAEKNV